MRYLIQYFRQKSMRKDKERNHVGEAREYIDQPKSIRAVSSKGMEPEYGSVYEGQY